MPSPDPISEARRSLAWALLLSLAILALMVALLAGFTLLRLLPHAPLLVGSSEPVTLPSGERVHPAWLRVAVPAFAISLGLGAASVWGLFWLRREWAKSPTKVETKSHKKSTQTLAPSNKPKKKRKR
ncbi:hypothetical protein [Meiothermus sp.]|uniref:hypothetical protein n=1 Tax=Meiothermus sp. TaxID=1955249 RepID=UPI00307EE40F